MVGTQQVTTGGGRGSLFGAPRRGQPSHPYPAPRVERHRPEQRAEAVLRHRQWLVTGLLLGGAASVTALGAANEFLLAEIAGPILAVTAVHGLWRGGLFKLLMLSVWGSLALLVATWPGLLDLLIDPAADGGALAWNAVICLGVLLLAMIIVGRAVRGLRRRLMAGRGPGVLTLDHLFGAAFGTAQAGFILLVLCWAVVLIEPQARAALHHPNMPAESPRHQVAAAVVRLTGEINNTPLESVAHESNLLERVPFALNALCDLAEGQRLALESTNSTGSRRQHERGLREPAARGVARGSTQLQVGGGS